MADQSAKQPQPQPQQQPARTATQARGQAQVHAPAASTASTTAPAPTPAPTPVSAPAPTPASADLPQVNYPGLSDDDFRSLLDEAANDDDPEATLQAHLHGANAQKDRWRDHARDITGRLDAIRATKSLYARLAAANVSPDDLKALQAEDPGKLADRLARLAPRPGPGDAVARPETLDARGAAPQAGAVPAGPGQ